MALQSVVKPEMLGSAGSVEGYLSRTSRCAKLLSSKCIMEIEYRDTVYLRNNSYSLHAFHDSEGEDFRDPGEIGDKLWRDMVPGTVCSTSANL